MQLPQPIRLSRLLNLVGATGLALQIFLVGVLNDGSATDILFSIVLACFLGFLIGLNRALRRGEKVAWWTQKVVFIFCGLAFPVGTLIGGYLWKQCSNPDVRAWFDK